MEINDPRLSMDIDVNKFYKTVDCRKVRIYAKDVGNKRLIHGAYLFSDIGEEWISTVWQRNGIHDLESCNINIIF